MTGAGAMALPGATVSEVPAADPLPPAASPGRPKPALALALMSNPA